MESINRKSAQGPRSPPTSLHHAGKPLLSSTPRPTVVTHPIRHSFLQSKGATGMGLQKMPMPWQVGALHSLWCENNKVRLHMKLSEMSDARPGGVEASLTPQGSSHGLFLTTTDKMKANVYHLSVTSKENPTTSHRTFCIRQMWVPHACFLN